jgi:flagellar basal-body rod modification protein FlgD
MLDALSSTTNTGNNTLTGTSAKDAQDRFLKLLVAQLQNQDPLNPLDNAQMTSQMAQINTVNGIAQLNETMQGMSAQFGATQSMQAAALIGRTVEVASPKIALADGKADINIALPNGADTVTVNVLNDAGVVVRTLELGKQSPGRASATWDGKNADGQAMTAGAYKLEVKASTAGKAVDAVALARDSVTGVTMTSGQAQLQLTKLGGTRLTDVISIL